MATTTKKGKIKDFFNPITNPGGGLTAGGKPTMASLLMANRKSKPTETNRATIGSGDRRLEFGSKPSIYDMMGPRNDNNNLRSTLRVDSEGNPVRPPDPVVNNPVAPTSQQGGGGRAMGGGSAPAPAASTAPEAPVDQTPQQWKNPDGSMKTPEQVASEISSTLATAEGRPDVGRLAADEIGGPEKTAEQLRTEAANLANIRNDIAAGETDPYGVAGESGIAWTPEQLTAIENAQAGIYDPALNSVFARLEAKQAADAEASEREFELEKADKEFERDLQMMDKKFQYDTALKQMGINADAVARAEKAAIEDSEADDANRDVQISTVATVNNLLNSDDLDAVVGSLPENFLTGSLLTGRAETRGQLAQLKAMTALGERDKLKGSGSISNFEQSMVADAANSINHAITEKGTVRMNQEDFRQQLRNLRGVTMLKAGVPSVSVTVTDPGTGEEVTGELSREELEDMHTQGILVDFN